MVLLDFLLSDGLWLDILVILFVFTSVQYSTEKFLEWLWVKLGGSDEDW